MEQLNGKCQRHMYRTFASAHGCQWIAIMSDERTTWTLFSTFIFLYSLIHGNGIMDAITCCVARQDVKREIYFGIINLLGIILCFLHLHKKCQQRSTLKLIQIIHATRISKMVEVGLRDRKKCTPASVQEPNSCISFACACVCKKNCNVFTGQWNDCNCVHKS